MKNIVNTIAETLLVASFVALLTIPVMVFGGFSPTVRSPKVKPPVLARRDVLGAQTKTDKETVTSYKTELLPTTGGNIAIEEAIKENDSYAMTIRAFSNKNEEQKENLLRIVNTADTNQTIIIRIEDYYQKNDLKNVKLLIDNTGFLLADLVENSDFEPAITLEPDEWLTIGITLSEKQEEPTSFTVKADFFTK